ncbi:hypothetical protein HYALB_00008355 [Hymenoscyphus albidus]|uniref:Uncharacterized protein n=1 Tax=Hymenoscyphus albidus TaxID=595503 RepID=A0A9N9Q734_9HELO|nr:hypothetical protein HYALB_00008355 [Hymenoscyphus albidus]
MNRKSKPPTTKKGNKPLANNPKGGAQSAVLAPRRGRVGSGRVYPEVRTPVGIRSHYPEREG